MKSLIVLEKTMKKYSTLLCVCVASLVLVSCQSATTSENQVSQDEKIDSILARAAASAAISGQEKEKLALLEKIYARNNRDPAVAVDYVRALRQSNYMTQAAMVIAPFANSTDPNIRTPQVMLEYANILIELGDYTRAEFVARELMYIVPEQGMPYHILGIALDARGAYEDAEMAFEKALDYWEGDPSVVLNNLGLNLAEQGYIDRALETLRKARAVAPQRKEIERNIRIVSALLNQPSGTEDELLPLPPSLPSSKIKKPAVPAKPPVDMRSDATESVEGDTVVEDDVTVKVEEDATEAVEVSDVPVVKEILVSKDDVFDEETKTLKPMRPNRNLNE